MINISISKFNFNLHFIRQIYWRTKLYHPTFMSCYTYAGNITVTQKYLLIDPIYILFVFGFPLYFLDCQTWLLNITSLAFTTVFKFYEEKVRTKFWIFKVTCQHSFACLSHEDSNRWLLHNFSYGYRRIPLLLHLFKSTCPTSHSLNF